MKSKLLSIFGLGSSAISIGSVFYFQSLQMEDIGIQREVLSAQIEKKIEDSMQKIIKTNQLKSDGKFEENYDFAKLITNLKDFKQWGYDKYPKKENEYDEGIKKIGDDDESERTFTKSEFRELIKKLIKNTEEYPAAMLISAVSLQFPQDIKYPDNKTLDHTEYTYLTSSQLSTKSDQRLDINKFQKEDHKEIKKNTELNMSSNINKQRLDELVNIWFKNWNDLNEEGEFYVYEEILPIEKMKNINREIVGSVVTVYKQYKNKVYHLDLMLRGGGFGELRRFQQWRNYLNVSYKGGRKLGLLIWTMHVTANMKNFNMGHNNDLSKSYFGEISNADFNMRNFERWTNVEYKLKQIPNTTNKSRKAREATKNSKNQSSIKSNAHTQNISKSKQSNNITFKVLDNIENLLMNVKQQLRT